MKFDSSSRRFVIIALLSTLHPGSSFAPNTWNTAPSSIIGNVPSRLQASVAGKAMHVQPKNYKNRSRSKNKKSTSNQNNSKMNSEAEIHRDADCIFSVIDLDGNGFISREELTNHLSKSGYATDVINKIFTKMDANKDNQISKEEFRRGMFLVTALQTAPGLGLYNADFKREIFQDADQVFKSMDSDGNGEIDEFELKSLLGRKAFGYSDKAMDNIFQMLDTNGDKRISRNELRNAFYRYSALRQAIGQGPNFK